MTLDLTTSSGHTVVGVVFIAGFVMEKQEGNHPFTLKLHRISIYIMAFKFEMYINQYTG